jgi:hypothetical protein
VAEVISSAIQVFSQQNGEVTKAYYADLEAKGPLGEIATALFRCQKRSSRAKAYRRGRWRRAAYDVKQWSMGELCRLLQAHGEPLGFTWGWKEDPGVLFGERASYVLYVDIPDIGQVSFHSPDRGTGPEYAGEWDGQRESLNRIVRFCDKVMGADSVRAAAGNRNYVPGSAGMWGREF